MSSKENPITQLEKKIRPILENLLFSILKEKPENIVKIKIYNIKKAFIHDRLSSKKRRLLNIRINNK